MKAKVNQILMYIHEFFYETPSKPRRKSSGWTPGKPRLRKNRFPTVKKTATLPRKEASVAV